MARINSVAKACAILLRIAAAEREISLRDLAADLGMNKTTVFHIVQTLCDEGFVEQDADTRGYRVGMKAYYAGQAVLYQRTVPKIALPFMHALMAEVRESVSLVLYAGGELVYVENVHPDRALRLVPRIGEPVPLHCTGSGKVYLASLPEAELHRVLAARVPLERRTERTITEVDRLLAELAHVRARGYAIDDEELEPGLVCVAAPIRDHTGGVIAALSVSGNSVRLRALGLDSVVAATVRTADRISQELGWVPAACSDQLTEARAGGGRR